MGTMLGGVFTAPGWGLVGTRVALALTNYRETIMARSRAVAAVGAPGCGKGKGKARSVLVCLRGGQTGGVGAGP